MQRHVTCPGRPVAPLIACSAAALTSTRLVLSELHKVINEPDFLPLYFVRHIAQMGTLLRKHKGHLKISPAGRRMLEPANRQALQAVLFHITMWHFDLENLGWGLHGWPQCDAGVVLWSLAIAANDWQPRERIASLRSQ